MTNYFLIEPSGDAYENLARDELMLNELAPDCVVLHLYVNERAVIIGRNQNPYIECNMDKLDADGVQLVRRISGGGAVYHDGGNLNYSFIAPTGIYDEKRQIGVILDALKRFGIEAELNGRNDITAGGLKFSGMAFAQRGLNRQQHGTLLVNTDLNALSSYLTPSKLKLAAKGVKSVRSRVCNLCELNPALTVEKLKTALYEAFEREYGTVQSYPMDERFLKAWKELTLQRASHAWRMGESPRYDIELETRLTYGLFRLYFKVGGGRITDCKVFSDCLDESLPEAFSAALTGVSFDPGAMADAVSTVSGETGEMSAWLHTLSL